jgi:type IV pilus assembly protein PilY1
MATPTLRTQFARALVFCAFIAQAHAAPADLASEPLVVSNSITVLPNLMFILDDSGSMASTYMPDNANSFRGKYGYSSSQCNGVYYNPAINYLPPVDANGVSYANATFTAAWTNGYSTGAGTTNLSTSFIVDGNLAAQAAFYYIYSGTQTTARQKDYFNTGSAFYKECNSASGSAPGSAVFTKVAVGAAEQQNFANWYSYYRTRMLMMKTASGQAFKGVDNHYRVGFMTINNNVAPDFLNIDTFDSAQKTAWYGKLYGAVPNQSTPIRTALSNAGKIYAKKLATLYNTAVTDPIQYSCQQNFTLLSTDGYWNSTGGSKLDNTAMDNQDDTEIRPFFDGALTVKTDVTPTVTVSKVVTPRTITDRYTATVTTNDTTSQTRTDTYTRTQVTIGATCGGGRRNVTTNTYTGTTVETVTTVTTTNQVTQTLTITTYDDSATVTSTTTETIVTTNGVAAAPTYNTTTSSSASPPVKTSGPTTTTSNFGAPTVSSTSTSTYSPANTIAGISWTPTGTVTQCKASPGASDTLALTAAGPLSAPTPISTTTTTGASTHTGGYPKTTTGTPTTTTISGPTVGATTTTITSSGGTSDTLADTAEYYYKTDLRDATTWGNATGVLGTDVSANNVGTTSQDKASWQHMTTFTLGLGTRGRMVFSPTYTSDTSGDYVSVLNGASANSAAVPPVCSWQTNGTTCNWPVPAQNTPEAVDDLWHAAVNGRGLYFGATDPATLATGLAAALRKLNATLAASAAATASNPNVTSGDNFVFSSSFITKDWTGELKRQQLDLSTGVVSSTIDWAAQGLLDTKVAGTGYLNRVIYTFSGSAGNKLKTFTWGSLTAAEQSYFTLPYISSLAQFCAVGVTCLSAANQTLGSGINLVHFLRGDRSNESTLYRARAAVLGDIVNSQATYVKSSLRTYVDPGFAAYKAGTTSRTGVVYVGANDGMLHAFDAATGNELWAYVPSFVLPQLYRLADVDYAIKHRYSVDASPNIGDVCVSNCGNSSAVWKTILISGLGGGGRGYFALDITDPANPSALWEFSDTNMGYTYGKPRITKLKDGTWVVLLASGYNNINSGDGAGRLYVLNVATGVPVASIGSGGTISTGVGDTTTPSGFAHLNSWVGDIQVDNTSRWVYGGDLLGNVWRFDINGDIGAAGYDAQLLATLKDASGIPQPITTVPQATRVREPPAPKPVTPATKYFNAVFIGTGSYLGVSDLTNKQVQSYYAIKDDLGSASLGNPRSNATFVQQGLTTTTCPAGNSLCSLGQVIRTSTNKTVDFNNDNGWYFDLPGLGERDNTDPIVELGTVTFNTNIPSSDACNAGGSSFAYFVDYHSGGAVNTGTATVNTIIAESLGNAIATSPVILQLPSGKIVTLTRLSNDTTITLPPPIANIPGPVKRISWRELAF